MHDVGTSRSDAADNETVAVGRYVFEGMAAALEASGRYRILRRLEPRTAISEPDGTPTRRAVFVDVETTGLDPATDEVIELAMIGFDYADDGRIFSVHEPFDRLRDPGRPIPESVTSLTGITDAAVAGAVIDPTEVSAFVGPAALVVAHHAAFDRRFCERIWPVFVDKPWACSCHEVPWKEEGFADGKLSSLAAGHGLFFDGHRAANDCLAGIDILSRELPRSGRAAFSELLRSARASRWRVWATGAPFERRDVLKARGYRWSAGGNGRPRAWYVDVADDAREAELQFLQQEIFRGQAQIETTRSTAFDRYSDRC